MSRQEVPPEMEFEDDEVAYEITEQGPRPRPRRPESAWEKQAATWSEPEFHAVCCGTVYGAMIPRVLSLMIETHKRARHAS